MNLFLKETSMGSIRIPVNLVKAIRNYGGYSLRDAKEMVDDLRKGESVTVQIREDETHDSLESDFNSLGVSIVSAETEKFIPNIHEMAETAMNNKNYKIASILLDCIAELQKELR